MSNTYRVSIVYNDAPNETAILVYNSLNEALEAKQAFINYGKCKSVNIEGFN